MIHKILHSIYLCYVHGFKQILFKTFAFKNCGEDVFPARAGRKWVVALEKLAFFGYFLGQCQKVTISDTGAYVYYVVFVTRLWQ